MKSTLLLVLIAFAIGACQPENTAIPTLVEFPTQAVSDVEIQVTPTLEVTPFGIGGRALAAAIARSCPLLSCPRIAAFENETFMLVNAVNGQYTETSDVWYEAQRGNEIFYIHSGSVTVLHPINVTNPTTSGNNNNTNQSQSIPNTNTNSSNSNVSCPNISATCSQLTCAQAYACLRAGNTDLDANGDGIPCESICG
jgi:hypothetical protein